MIPPRTAPVPNPITPAPQVAPRDDPQVAPRDDPQADRLTTPAPQVAAIDEYRPAHIDAKDTIAFALLKMKEIYDARHQPLFFKEGDLVNLRLYRGYSIPAIKFKKIE